MNKKSILEGNGGSKVTWYGLDTSSVIVEHVPLITGGSYTERRIKKNG